MLKLFSFYLFLCLLRTSAPVRLFSISACVFLCLGPESGESGCKLGANVTTSAFVTTNVLINGERINK